MPASVYCAHCGALNQPQASTCFACARSLDEPAPATDARRLVGSRYRLVRQLGVGGFGAVYQAEDTQLGHRLVALKEMSPRGLSAEEAQEATQAFQREALLLAGLAHPSLPRIYERFEEEGRWYLVMDFIAGETLEVYLDRQGGSLPVKEALQLALHLTQVLGYLHSRQPPIIFRDLKPSNIIRSPEGQVTLVDFGIARFFKPGQSKDTMAFGSPGYAAPEQYGKAQTTPRSDIFSLGALLHQMLTGSDPSDTPFRFAPLSMPRPAGLSALIEGMVQVEESQRPSSMEVIRRELERLLDERAPWSTDNLARTGASSPSARVAASGALAAGLAAQPAGYTSPFQPWAAPQSAAKKAKGSGWAMALVLILLCVGIPVIAGFASFLHPSHSAATLSVPSNFNGDGSAASVPVYALAWSPDGRYLASAGGDGKVEIWTIGSSQPEVSIETKAVKTTELAWSPDGGSLASLDNGVVDLWKVGDTGYGTTYTYATAFQPAAGLTAFAWSPKSDEIAMAFDNGDVRVVNVSTKAIDMVIPVQNGSENVIAWSPDGTRIATGGIGHRVDVFWLTGAGGYLAYYHEGYAGNITSIAWSPDSHYIAVADTSSTVHVWDALTGDDVSAYPGNASTINTVAWSPNGNYLAAGDQQGLVEVWSPGSSAPVLKFHGHIGSILAVAWSPDGKRIASAGSGGTVQIWDAFTGDHVVTYQQP